MPVSFQTKAMGTLTQVDHKSQLASGGGTSATAKLEWTPDQKLGGKSFTFALFGSDQTLLQNPKQLKSAYATAKVALTNNFLLTGLYNMDKNKVSLSAKFGNVVAKRAINTEVSNISKDGFGAIGLQSEMFVTNDTKLAVESWGKKPYSAKVTHTHGGNAFRLKYFIQAKEPVIGWDTINGKQRWDFEYNFISGRLDGIVKVFPISLAAMTKITNDGIAPLTYKITAERTISF